MDEFAEVRLTDGTTRHGVVLEVAGDLAAVVQVLEGTDGIAPARASVTFTGSPLRIPVEEAGWLGRTCNGRGDPLDGGPPITGDASRT